MALSIGIAIQNFPEGAVISIPLRGEDPAAKNSVPCKNSIFYRNFTRKESRPEENLNSRFSMKKTIALILGIILVLSLTACGKSAEKEKTVYQRGDTVTLKNWEITITDFQFFDFSDKEEHPEENQDISSFP